jgi:hypothetical protein
MRTLVATHIYSVRCQVTLLRPRDTQRHIGPKGIRFRSKNEFIPHAFWLMNPTTNCACRYCSKRPQQDVGIAPGSSKWNSTPPSSPGPHRMKLRSGARLHELRKPYASMRRSPIPQSNRSASPKGTAHNTDLSRSNDAGAVASGTETPLKRWFHEGELVWCALENPIRGPTREADIVYWPGLVQEAIVKPDAIPRRADGAGEPSGNDLSLTSGNSGLTQTFVHQTMYAIKFLAIHRTSLYPQHQVLPYQAYVLTEDSELSHALNSCPIEGINVSCGFVRNFDPEVSTSELDDRNRFENSVGPYILALQATADISKLWSPTTSARAISTDVDIYPETPSRGMDLREGIAKQVLAQIPRPLTTYKICMRYEGIWWGAERIWTDDLVRLTLLRSQLAPRRSPEIYPAAGPSQSAIEFIEKTADLHGLDAKGIGMGAASRGVFMKMDGVFLVSLPTSDGHGVNMEFRAAGMLYELADVDWVDSLDSGGQSFGSQLNTKFALTCTRRSLCTGNGIGSRTQAFDAAAHSTHRLQVPSHPSARQDSCDAAHTDQRAILLWNSVTSPAPTMRRAFDRE